MDNYLALPEEQLLYYTNHINDRFLKEKAKENGYLELYELLMEENYPDTMIYD